MTVADVIAELEQRVKVQWAVAERKGMPRYQRREHRGKAEGMEEAIALLEQLEEG